MTMDSVHHVSVPLRAGKKMKKRKELDALVAHSAVAGKRCVSGGKRCGGSGVSSGGGGGISSHDGLLSESTDEDDYWVVGKTRGSRGRMLRHRACSSLVRACTVVLIFACVVATTTVMWLFIDIREQVTSLRIELDQVVAGSQGVPDALQKCHSISRELQQNQTALFNRLATLSLQIGNFSAQLGNMQYGLHNLEERLKATPELVNVPQDLKELRANVAVFGSQINDLEATVASLKDQYSQLQDTSKNLLSNVTTFQDSFGRLLNASRHPEVVAQESKEEKTIMLNEIAQMAINISKVNDTLISKLNWLVEDQQKDHKLIEVIQNVGQNVSARVTTLEGECAKTVAVTGLNTTVAILAAKLNNGTNLMYDLDRKITQLQSKYENIGQNQQVPIKLSNSGLEPVLVLPSATPSTQPPSPSSVLPIEQVRRP